jgi:hypothetical protein
MIDIFRDFLGTYPFTVWSSGTFDGSGITRSANTKVHRNHNIPARICVI